MVGMIKERLCVFGDYCWYEARENGQNALSFKLVGGLRTLWLNAVSEVADLTTLYFSRLEASAGSLSCLCS